MDSIINWCHNLLLYISGNNQVIQGAISLWFMGTLTFIGSKLWVEVINLLKRQFTTTIELNSSNSSYYSLIKELEKQRFTERLRFLQILNNTWGTNEPILGIGTGIQYIKLFGKICKIYTSQYTYSQSITYNIKITYLFNSKHFNNKILEKSKLKNKNDNKLVIGRTTENGITIHYQEYENIEAYILNSKTKKLITYIKEFISKKDLYYNKGLSHKTGILLHGVPGSGKTHFIRILATIIKYDIVLITNLAHLHSIPHKKNAIFVFEEVDLASLKRTANTNDSIMDSIKSTQLENLLEFTDGILQNVGHIYIFTTNYVNKLDKALLRPGRIDHIVKFGYVTNNMFRDFIEKYYNKKIQCSIKKKVLIASLLNAYKNNMTLDNLINQYGE